MRKVDEIARENSCLGKAESEEMLFVLLARDPAAPVALRAWIEERIRLGLNSAADDQITEAYNCMTWMKLQRTFPHHYMPMWAERKRVEAEQCLERR